MATKTKAAVDIASQSCGVCGGALMPNGVCTVCGTRHEIGANGMMMPVGSSGPRSGSPDPGMSKWLYHAESAQEGFLVLSGEALLLIEEQERPLRAWDFVHCPPGTAHAFLGVGHRPCVMIMVGARSRDDTIVYPRSELALRQGVGVEAETRSPEEALRPFGDWQPGRPDGWDALPWA